MYFKQNDILTFRRWLLEALMAAVLAGMPMSAQAQSAPPDELPHHVTPWTPTPARLSGQFFFSALS